MPYKPTGNPPGRPRKHPAQEADPALADVIAREEDRAGQSGSAKAEPGHALPRAREGYRRAFADPSAGLWHPPRYGPRRKREVGRKPILHPNVIAKV